MTTNTVQNAGQSEDAANTAPTDGEDFDAVLDAAIAASEGAPADDAAAGFQQDDGKQNADEEPAPASDAADQVPGADGGDATPPQGSANDPWANAPPELREAFEKEKRDWELRFRSANGRVSALQRQIAQQQTPKQEPAQQQPQTQQEETHQPNAGATSGINLKDPKFQQMREDFPEVAGPLLDLLDVVVGRLDQVSKTTGSVEQQQAEQYLAVQEQTLAEQHPDWKVAASDDRFGGWLQEQPLSIQQAFERNREAIVDGRDASLVIGMFKQAVGFSSQQQQQPAPSAPAPDQRRQRQLASGRDVGRTAPPVATGIADNDLDAHLDFAIAKLERQQQ